MKRINILYLLFIPLSFVWYKMHSNFNQQSVFFYGFAENKETELSHDQDVLIYKIHVTPGQEVKEGDLLMEVSQDKIGYEIKQVESKLSEISIDQNNRKKDIINQIALLESKKSAKIKSFDIRISEIEKSILNNKDLLENLALFKSHTIDEKDSPLYLQLASLKELRIAEIKPIDVQIEQLKEEQSTLVLPYQNTKRHFQNEMKYLNGEQEKLKIIAPTDGMIGNIMCKEGENISAFRSLINFYEPRPTIVKGFVHESLILAVQKSDSLQITSSLHQDLKVYGEVIGLGNRIVEIPERMRKIIDVKTYGREILIKIPQNNPFLQKEKVFLNALPENYRSDLDINDTTFNRHHQLENKNKESIAEILK